MVSWNEEQLKREENCLVLETPLSCACVDLLEPKSMLMTLVNGGAHLDFRTRDGALTPLHHSAIHYRKQSIIVRGTNLLRRGFSRLRSFCLDVVGVGRLSERVRRERFNSVVSFDSQ